MSKTLEQRVNQVKAKIGEMIIRRLTNDKGFHRLSPESFDDRRELRDDGLFKAIKLIIESDPSPNKGYTSWIIESYLDGGIKSLEDLGRTRLALDTFLKWRGEDTDDNKKDWKRDINRYCGIAGCKSESKNKRDRPYNMLKTGPECRLKGERCEWSLERHLKKVSPDYLTKDVDASGFLDDVIYSNPPDNLVRLSSVESAIFWGKATNWCTASQRNNMFKSYNSQGPLYVIAQNTKGKYQLHPATQQFMDVNDKSVNLERLAILYPTFIKETSQDVGPTWNRSLITRNRFSLVTGETLFTKYKIPEDYRDDTRGVSISLHDSSIRSPYYDESNHRLKKISYLDDVQTLKGLNLEEVSELSFGYTFNESVDDLDLKGVVALAFGESFNRPIDKLDLKRVTSLTLGEGFNQSIDKLDLKRVTSLTLGEGFNQSISGLYLKSRLKNLTGSIETVVSFIDNMDIRDIDITYYVLKPENPYDFLDDNDDYSDDYEIDIG